MSYNLLGVYHGGIMAVTRIQSLIQKISESENVKKVVSDFQKV
jgi:hypothetical protein